MSVHYKFKSALDFDTITFDGLHISVADLKKEIIHHKRLGKVIDYDLQITNAQTKEEYSDNAALIPKNTSLIIARVPLAHQPKKGWDPQADKPQIVKPIAKPNPDTLDLSQMNGTEEDKINAMMQQSTMDYDPKGYQKLRGQSQTGEVPANYRCYKCLKPGHWIKNCPLNSLKDPMPEIKRTAGIPRSFIDKDENSEMTEEEQKAFVAPEQKSEIPDDLICSICKDIFTDAVMIPCCGSSFCDECVRTSLLESEDNECPDCKEKGCSPASLIPNRFLRNSVNTFKNETGYSQPQKPAQLKIVHKPPPQSKEASSQIQKQATPEPEKPAQEPEAKKVSDVENKKDVVENKEKESVENTEKKDVLGTAGGHISSHDESDYEDNITVTVPPAHMQSHGPPRTYNGNSSRKNRGDGYYNNHDQDSNRDDDRDNSDATPSEGHIESHQHHQSSSNSQSQMQGYYSSREPMMHHRGQGGGPPMYPPHQNQSGPGGPPNMGRPYMDNNHHQRLPQYQGGPPPPGGYPPYYRQPFMPQRPQGGYGMGPMGPGGPPQRQPGPQHNLAAVYQNVQQKLGTGIIDDPLEAFNRLMQDREARKEHQSRGLGDGRHERHRFSRSPDRYRGKFGGHPGRQWPKSPPPGNRGRHISPTGRHRYGERPREDRDRERERDRVKERRRRSSSGSERTSRSPARIPSKSAAPRRRSWSRSPSFRNRSRSRSAVREHDMRVQQYPQHSPRRSVSPRYRQEERSRYRSRGRADSQSRVRSRRRSRERFSPNNGRNVSPPPSVRQLKPTGRYPSERGPSPRRGGYDEFQNIQTDQRSGGSARFSRDRERERRPSKEFQQMPPQNRYDNFDIEGPAANEPPPPGFENSNNYDPYGHSMDGYQRDMNRSGYTPEPKDIENPKRANSTTRKSKHISRSESTEKSVKSSKKHKDADSGEKKKSSTKHSKKQEKEKDSKTKKDLDTSTDSVKVKKVKDKKKKKKDDKEKKKLKKEKKHKKAKTNDTSSENEIKDDPDEFRLDSEKTKSKSKSKSPPPKEEEKPVAIQEEPENIPTSTTEMNESLDLYDDLCMDNDIKFDSSREEDKEIKEDEQNNQKESESKSESEFVAPRDKDKDSSPHTFGKLNDSVLDIYDFGENFDDLNTSMTKVEEPDNEPKPPASKWDEEEGEIVGGDGSDEEIKDNNNSNHPITNEVLRRAENAIFTRAINAIRPIEKKIIRDRSLSRSPAQKVHITIPVNSMHMERSVEIKSDIPPPHPKGSIKDRLGVKVPDSTSGNNHRSTSRPRSPRVDRGDRERERERERERDRLRENRKGRSNERERERERDRERPRVNSRGPKERDAAESRSSRDAVSRERAGRERDRDRDEIRRDRPKNDDLKRVRERDERSRREPERSEERIRENRDRERENKDRSRNDREREREQINTRKRLSSPDASTKPTEKRSRHDDDNRDRQREKDLKHSQRERDRDQSDRLKKDDREKDRDQHREREREKDVERENRDKEAHKRKLAEERKSDSSSDSSSSSSDSDSNSDDEKSKKRKKHKKKEKKKKSSKSKKKKEKKSKSKK